MWHWYVYHSSAPSFPVFLFFWNICLKLRNRPVYWLNCEISGFSCNICLKLCDGPVFLLNCEISIFSGNICLKLCYRPVY